MNGLAPDSRIFVAGHTGLIGSAMVRRLTAAGHPHLLTASRDEIDLRSTIAVETWFRDNRPDIVVMAAGTVGGIQENASRPADLIYDNLMIQSSVIRAAHVSGVDKLLYLACACIYPRDCPQPIAEDFLLTSPLEPTNEPYALAKIAGISMCASYRRQYGHNFIVGVASNLYGPGDDFDLDAGHVVPVLIRKFHDAKITKRRQVAVWGSGTPTRDFLHVDDLADACCFLLASYEGEAPVNIGTGEEVSVRHLAETVRDVVYPEAEIVFDATKPDGMPRKILDVARIRNLGWRHSFGLQAGIEATYHWLCEQDPASVRGWEAGDRYGGPVAT